MKVLIIGSGGREHAIGYKAAQSSLVTELYFAPGNGGTAQLGKNIPIGVVEIWKLCDFAKKENIGLTIVGPELPLTLGIVDLFQQEGLAIFGPDQAGARLESSKSYSKDFMKKYNIPTGAYETFSETETALAYLKGATFPIVVKADGLAAGKGVLICEDFAQAQQAVCDILENKVFGEQGSKVVIEEFLIGKEVSLLCFTDSKTIVPMESASDYKRAYDNDQGLNTGGMGSISPSFYYETGSCDFIAERTLAGIQKEGLNVKGVVYIGLMLTTEGAKVLEYNMRFGDPETEALLIRLERDLVQVILDILDEKLDASSLKWSKKKAITVVVAAKGYPGTPETGVSITLPPTPENIFAFHSATQQQGEKFLSSGGRVLAISALAESMQAAREDCYAYLKTINFSGSFYRSDIGAEDEKNL